MESLHNIVRRGEAMNRDDLISLLSLTEAEDLEILYNEGTSRRKYRVLSRLNGVLQSMYEKLSILRNSSRKWEREAISDGSQRYRKYGTMGL